jgi:hypothetical protein
LLAARLLPTKHRELMPRSQQLDLFGEHVAAAAVHEQPQQGREREIGEGKDDPATLPDLPAAGHRRRNLVLKPLAVLRAAICSFAS